VDTICCLFLQSCKVHWMFYSINIPATKLEGTFWFSSPLSSCLLFLLLCHPLLNIFFEKNSNGSILIHTSHVFSRTSKANASSHMVAKSLINFLSVVSNQFFLSHMLRNNCRTVWITSWLFYNVKSCDSCGNVLSDLSPVLMEKGTASRMNSVIINRFYWKHKIWLTHAFILNCHCHHWLFII